jgi:hypothetical protein
VPGGWAAAWVRVRVRVGVGVSASAGARASAESHAFVVVRRCERVIQPSPFLLVPGLSVCMCVCVDMCVVRPLRVGTELKWCRWMCGAMNSGLVCVCVHVVVVVMLSWLCMWMWM